LPLQKAALRKALELDPGSAEAHRAKAIIHMEGDCDLAGAGSELKEALRLNPNMADAHDLYSSYLAYMGRVDESILELKRAQELDPAGLQRLAILMANHQYDQVIALRRQYLELHPNDGFAYIDGDGLINAYHFAGRYRESIEALQHAWIQFGFKEIGQGVGKAYAASGYAGALRYSARQMEHLYAEGKVWKPDMIAQWYARAGDKEQALKWIGITLADNNHCWLGLDLGLDRELDFVSMHSDSRFQEFVKPLAAQ
jgi:tetratricopeptide (TPR) repeat protein